MVNYEGIDRRIPVLANSEIKTSTLLGSGGFCSVSSIRKICLLEEQSVNLNQEEIDARSRLAKQFQDYEQKYFSAQNIVVPGQTPTIDPLEQRPPRIALKRVKSSLPNARYKTGVKDLMAEIEILASCTHPHIIALYAVGCDERDGDSEGRLASSILSKRRLSFAVIDQLRSTLRDKMHKWKEDRGIQFVKSTQSQHKLWLERLIVILNVADAIRYLHSKKIVHRDINPDNIGFADDQVVKVFDFGLARVVEKEQKLTLNGIEHGNSSWEDDDLFELTGTTGTMRYMAPEVALDLPYGFKVDVYSLGLVMYEVLSLTKPFIHVQPQLFVEEVTRGGLRPTLDEGWPCGIKSLLQDMWASDSGKRPSSSLVVDRLGYLLRGDDYELYPGKVGWMGKLEQARRKLTA
mmetsp:Transcript_5485/g.10456  ORF Transcript_5485/g.10456 Transcript_5485/m.10456 type:complete len:405 (+) Transcript_5485:43-1257(+)